LRKAKDPLVVEHKDHGCKLFPVCLDCTLPVCIEDMPAFKQNVRLLHRAIEVDTLHKQGKSLTEIAALLKVSQRTVRRDMDLLKK
jgi:hypothetical protein